MNYKVQISIILATYNRAHLILETLESIANQSFKNWECLIIDDGSEDETTKVVEEFTSRDSRFMYLSRTKEYKKGLPGCRNQGLDLAKGEFVIFFDDDDIVHPKNLQTCFDLLRGSEFYFCRYDKKPFWQSTDQIHFRPITISNTKSFKLQDIDKMITGEIPFASCCVLWSKECFKKERFNEELMYAEEWELYSRILAKGYLGVSINEILYFNRKHPESNTGEFQRKEPIRLNSKIQAASMVINNLDSKKLFSENLKTYFLRMGFELGSLVIIKKSLNAFGANSIEKLKYQIGYKFYPILKPIFYLKGKIKKH